MNSLQKYIEIYLGFCQTQKRLNEKTLRAYKIDLTQFCQYIHPIDISEITPEILEDFIAYLHKQHEKDVDQKSLGSSITRIVSNFVQYDESGALT